MYNDHSEQFRVVINRFNSVPAIVLCVILLSILFLKNGVLCLLSVDVEWESLLQDDGYDLLHQPYICTMCTALKYSRLPWTHLSIVRSVVCAYGMDVGVKDSLMSV